MCCHILTIKYNPIILYLLGKNIHKCVVKSGSVTLVHPDIHKSISRDALFVSALTINQFSTSALPPALIYHHLTCSDMLVSSLYFPSRLKQVILNNLKLMNRKDIGISDLADLVVLICMVSYILRTSESIT